MYVVEKGNKRCCRVVMFLDYIELMEKCVENAQMEHNKLNYINYTQKKKKGNLNLESHDIFEWSKIGLYNFRSTFIRNFVFCYCLMF